MKHARLALLLVIAWLPGPAFAQTGCGCDRILPVSGRGFTAEILDFKERDAQRIIDDYCEPFLRKTNRRPYIIAKPFACPGYSALAILCPPNEQRYVFYDKPFFDDLTAQSNWGAQFVLAHEIAHHVLGHPVEAYNLPLIKGGRQAIDSVTQHTTIQTVGRNRKPKVYTINIPRRHLHELEADALGLWMTIQKGATRADIEKIFKVLPTILVIPDPTHENDTHPSLAIRERLIRRQWDRYDNPGFKRKYTSIDANQKPYSFTDTDDEDTQLKKDIESAYAVELVYADQKLLKRLDSTEISLRNTLTTRSGVFVELVLGGQYQQPALSRNQATVDAMGSQTIMGGLRVGVGAWYRSHRFEADLLGSASVFTTRAPFGDQMLPTERFQSTYLQVRPRYVFSRLNHVSRYSYHSSGWMATAGFSVGVPVRFTYTNLWVANYQTPKQGISVAPVLGIGYGVSSWLTRNGHFRAWLLYQPQSQVFTPIAPGESLKATIHTVSLECSIRLW